MRRKKILSLFSERGEQGEFLMIDEIRAAFEKEIGHRVHKTTIYRLLKRHHWRKITPRPERPKSDPKQQEKFKKEFPQLVEQTPHDRPKDDHRPIVPLTQDEGR